MAVINPILLNELVIDERPFGTVTTLFIYHKEKLIGSFIYFRNYLQEIHFQREYKRKGLGTYFINKFKIEEVDCSVANAEGIKFYKSLGFKQYQVIGGLITFKRIINEVNVKDSEI